ncbi:MAG: hypothetical protein HC836_47525 [Richelia sp. RM2_1_2]|nr:hypothetical protein [Richelia sp. RM2_1_2]
MTGKLNALIGFLIIAFGSISGLLMINQQPVYGLFTIVLSFILATVFCGLLAIFVEMHKLLQKIEKNTNNEIK